MTQPTYTYDAAWAAMCIWEELCASQFPEAPTPWQELWETVGTAEIRGLVLALGEPCDAAWARARDTFETEYCVWQNRRDDCAAKDQPFYDDPPTDVGSFDWEFVPFWVRECVDWSGETPRVKGGRS